MRNLSDCWDGILPYEKGDYILIDKPGFRYNGRMGVISDVGPDNQYLVYICSIRTHFIFEGGELTWQPPRKKHKSK